MLGGKNNQSFFQYQTSLGRIKINQSYFCHYLQDLINDNGHFSLIDYQLQEISPSLWDLEIKLKDKINQQSLVNIKKIYQYLLIFFKESLSVNCNLLITFEQA